MFRTFQIVITELGNVTQNETIEERVPILQFQVSSLNEDVTSLNTDVIDLGDEMDIIDNEIAVIFADKMIQNERIFDLEDTIVGKFHFRHINFIAFFSVNGIRVFLEKQVC